MGEIKAYFIDGVFENRAPNDISWRHGYARELIYIKRIEAATQFCQIVVFKNFFRLKCVLFFQVEMRLLAH